MTLVIAVASKKANWLLADRRITYADRPPEEKARKIMLLSTPTGSAILGYCGLGKSIGGVEPSEWMNRVLRGTNYSLADALKALGSAIEKEFPRHLATLDIAGELQHCVVAPAFEGGNSIMVTVNLFRDTSGQWVNGNMIHNLYKGQLRSGHVLLTGSGMADLVAMTTDRNALVRRIRKIIRRHAEGLLPALAVAKFFAQINKRVHDRNLSGTVGSRSIVICGTPDGACVQFFFDGDQLDPDPEPTALPSISNGLDETAFVGLMTPLMLDFHSRAKADPTAGLDWDAFKAGFERLSHKPDSTLD